MKKEQSQTKTILKNFWWWHGDTIKAILATIVILTGFVCLINFTEQRHCLRAFANYNPEYVGMTTGCMITVDEQRVPASSLRMTL